jgi:hypothetical protein
VLPSLTDSKASLGAAEALICGLHTTEMVQLSLGARVVQSLSTMLKSDEPSSPTTVDVIVPEVVSLTLVTVKTIGSVVSS